MAKNKQEALEKIRQLKPNLKAKGRTDGEKRSTQSIIDRLKERWSITDKEIDATVDKDGYDWAAHFKGAAKDNQRYAHETSSEDSKYGPNGAWAHQGTRSGSWRSSDTNYGKVPSPFKDGDDIPLKDKWEADAMQRILDNYALKPLTPATWAAIKAEFRKAKDHRTATEEEPRYRGRSHYESFGGFREDMFNNIFDDIKIDPLMWESMFGAGSPFGFGRGGGSSRGKIKVNHGYNPHDKGPWYFYDLLGTECIQMNDIWERDTFERLKAENATGGIGLLSFMVLRDKFEEAKRNRYKKEVCKCKYCKARQGDKTLSEIDKKKILIDFLMDGSKNFGWIANIARGMHCNNPLTFDNPAGTTECTNPPKNEP